MIAPAELARLADYCRGRGIRLVSDEIYHGITYEGAAATARAFGREAIVVNSFSKYYSMTGWRLGWMLAPPDLQRSIECLGAREFLHLAAGAVAVGRGGGVRLPPRARRACRPLHRANRDLLIAALQKAGLSRFAPAEGAFYLYVDVSALTRDSEAFSRRMLAETGVAVTPGRDFDPVYGDDWVRLSFAGSNDDIADAASRLAAWLPRQG